MADHRERDEARAEVERLGELLNEAAHRIAVAEQRFVDEYDRRKAACRVIDELEEQVLTYKERLERVTRERDEARADVAALIARVRELEVEGERLKTFAAQNFSAMIRQETEQMRAYGLSYEGVRQVLHEYNDGEISFGKLMDLIRAAVRAMAEEECAALRREIAALMDDH